MARFAVKTLEFDKVKALLASKTAATCWGRRRLLAIRTESEFSIVKRLQEETAEALRLLDEGKRFPFGGAHNIVAAVKHAQLGAVLEAETLMEIGSTAAAIRQIKTFLQEESELAPTLAAYAEASCSAAASGKQLENAISRKKARSKTVLRQSLAAYGLAFRWRKTVCVNSWKKSCTIPIIKNISDALVTMRGDRYVIPIKQEYKLNFPGVVHDQSGSGATLFIEPMAVVNLNNDIKKYMAEEKEEIERILRQLSGSVGADGDLLTAGVETLTNLDVICARAYLAQAQKAVRPMLHLGGKVEIVQGRHPLLDQSQVVPLDIELGGGFNTLLITGPNTGGKTVALKAVGLFALMAQAGLFLPARSAKMPVFRAIYADIGDEQSIEQSLSTFSGHMTNLVEILNEVRSGDLVLVDEICAGTDPNEGAALAMAMLEHLHEQGVLTMITTHYSELKTFAYGHTGMENASVEFDPVSLRPTYRLLMGVPGSSNAFNISRRLGLSEEIVENAGKLLDQEHVHMEDVLHELEGERRQYESQNKEIQMLRLESERIKQELHKQKQELDRRKNEMLRKAREQADEIYRSSRRESEAILKELRSMKADFDAKKLEAAAEAARKQLNKQFSEDAPLPEGTPLSKETAKVGQTVFLPSLRQNGTIVAVNGGDVTVQVGILKTNVPAKNCLLVKGKTKVSEDLRPKKRKGYAHDMLVTRTASTRQELDVRGMTIEEAIPTVDKGIDDALLAGLPELRIIHGKGTGALRAGLTAYLSAHRAVKRLELASLHEGGAGATVIYL